LGESCTQIRDRRALDNSPHATAAVSLLRVIVRRQGAAIARWLRRIDEKLANFVKQGKVFSRVIAPCERFKPGHHDPVIADRTPGRQIHRHRPISNNGSPSASTFAHRAMNRRFGRP